ncbi:hypothetical protein Z043_125175 [Scleropages formosus]|uniref:Uncharacterized protein n=1 Tax=Scleropages formosus TaxID=113540 RepID=A0A0P7W3T9_SCLFO|nr:hypothetical protein Z043_125175 [Scleropages formosus]
MREVIRSSNNRQRPTFLFLLCFSSRLKEDQSFFKLHFEKQVMMGEGYEGPWKTEGSVSSECHSASSSDCESVVSSDSEEQGKEAASVGEPRQSEEEDELCLHASGPRVRELRQSGSGRLPQVHGHQPVSRPWRIICNTDCPVDSAPMLGYYIYPYPKADPQFVVI